MNRTYIGLISAAIVVAMGCSDRQRTQAETHYRALLLPYVQKGASVAAVANTENDGHLALLASTDGHADHLNVLSVRDSAVEPFDKIALPDRLKALCPEKAPALFQASVAFALAPDGHGLLLARFGCGKNPIGAVWFERLGGRFVWVEQVHTMLPYDFRPGAIACASAGDCYFSFNRSLAAATPEGPSSISVARWRQGHFDALLLDEVESEGDRFFELRSLVAGANTVMVAAVETSAVGNGISRDLARMFLLRDERVDLVTGPEAFGTLTPAHASAQSTVVLGASTDDGRTAVLEISPTAEVKVHARLSAVPDALRTHLALLDGRVLDVLEQRLATQGAGWKNVLTLAGDPLDFPTVTLGASVAGLLVHGREALLFGEQLAKGPLGNLRAPLLIRITDQQAPASAAPLPDETADDTCTVPVDCLDQAWGVRCQGHFGCAAGRCERVCDVKNCGDGVCDTQGGESTETCLFDCAGSRDGGAVDSLGHPADGAGVQIDQSVDSPGQADADAVDLGIDG